MKTIHTNLYSTTALAILKSINGQLSDGWGENSPSLRKWYHFADIKQAVNGEVIIEISEENDYCERWDGHVKYIKNNWVGMNDLEIKRQYATWLKKTIYMEIADRDMLKPTTWQRDNTSFTSEYLGYKTSACVQDIYLVYETLLGRTVDTKYPSEVIAKIVGVPASSEVVAKEVAIRYVCEQIKKQYDTDRNALYAEEEQLKKDIADKMQARRYELYKEYMRMTSEAQAATII